MLCLGSLQLMRLQLLQLLLRPQPLLLLLLLLSQKIFSYIGE